jgi:intracellular septation protein A
LDFQREFKCLEKGENVSKFSRMALLELLGFILINFATPIAFYITFRMYGAKPAIGFAIGVTTLQVLCHWIFRIPFSPFFAIASGFTVLFGVIDLCVESPRFFRLEPAVQNFVIGTVFLGSLTSKVSIISRFANALPKNYRPDLSTTADTYLKNLTIIWTVYLYLKAVIFFYLATNVNLGELIVLRSLIGGGSLALLFVGELIYRKCLRRTA